MEHFSKSEVCRAQFCGYVLLAVARRDAGNCFLDALYRAKTCLELHYKYVALETDFTRPMGVAA